MHHGLELICAFILFKVLGSWPFKWKNNCYCNGFQYVAKTLAEANQLQDDLFFVILDRLLCLDTFSQLHC